MNPMKPFSKWIAWGNCERCGKRFDTRNRTKTVCADCYKEVMDIFTIGILARGMTNGGYMENNKEVNEDGTDD